MVDQSPSLELVQTAIEAHLSPTIHLPSLPRTLEFLAHVSLLADKLQQEITRILDSNRAGGYADLSDQAVRRLERCRIEVDKTNRILWQISVDLRLNVRFVSRSANRLTRPAYSCCVISRQEHLRQGPVPHRMLFLSTSRHRWCIIIEENI